jgi:hypothetical protein
MNSSIECDEFFHACTASVSGDLIGGALFTSSRIHAGTYRMPALPDVITIVDRSSLNPIGVKFRPPLAPSFREVMIIVLKHLDCGVDH